MYHHQYDTIKNNSSRQGLRQKRSLSLIGQDDSPQHQPRCQTQTAGIHPQRERKLTYLGTEGSKHVSNRKNFRIKYYEKMNIVRLRSVSNEHPSILSGSTHIAIGKNVARENFDWNDRDFSVIQPPPSPTDAEEFEGIFELEL